MADEAPQGEGPAGGGEDMHHEADDKIVDFDDQTLTADEAARAQATTAIAEENAVDDTEDVTDDFAQLQTTLSGEHREQTQQPPTIDDLLPFRFIPNVRPLSMEDVESCVVLQEATFSDPSLRLPREQIAETIRRHPELTIGVFCTVVPDAVGDWCIETLRTAHIVETGRPNNAVSVMFAHVIGSFEPTSVRRTVRINTVAVHPSIQGVGIGQMVTKSFLQQISNSRIADRAIVICHYYLVGFFKRFFGFVYAGPSDRPIGGFQNGHELILIITVPQSPGYQLNMFPNMSRGGRGRGQLNGGGGREPPVLPNVR